MLVGVLSLELFLPSSRSLKDKRRSVKSLKERLQNKFKVAVAEVEHQELHQRATLGVAAISQTEQNCRELLVAAKRFARLHHELQCSAAEIKIIKPF